MKYLDKLFVKVLLAAALLSVGISQAAITGNYTFNQFVMTFFDAGGTQAHQNLVVTGNINFDTDTGTLNSGGYDFQGFPWVADVQVVYQHNPAGTATQDFNFSTSEIKWYYTDVTDETCREITGSGTCIPDPLKTVQFTPGLAVIANYAFSLTAGQVALGTFFDWSVNLDIPVLMAWDVTDPSPAFANDCYTMTSLDTDGTGWPGTAMLTAPFPDQTPSFSGTIGSCLTNTPPTALSASARTTVDNAIDITLTATDIDGDPLTFSITRAPANGSLSGLTQNGDTATVTYTPDSNYQGADDFDFMVNDGTDDSVADGTININVAANTSGLQASNFTMLNANGVTFGGTNDVRWSWDGTKLTSTSDNTFNMTLASQTPHPFYGNFWTAHHIRVFGPGTYHFNTSCSTTDLENSTCSCTVTTNTTKVGINNRTVNACDEDGSPALSMTVAAGQIGAHMLFDWSISNNIDVVNVWEENGIWNNPDGLGGKNDLYIYEEGAAPDANSPITWVSIDVDGDGINGAAMNDGPFIDFSANFNLDPTNYSDISPFVAMTADDTQITAGCSLNSTPVSLTSRADWLALLGFLAILGLWRHSYRLIGKSSRHQDDK